MNNSEIVKSILDLKQITYSANNISINDIQLNVCSQYCQYVDNYSFYILIIFLFILFNILSSLFRIKILGYDILMGISRFFNYLLLIRIIQIGLNESFIPLWKIWIIVIGFIIIRILSVLFLIGLFINFESGKLLFHFKIEYIKNNEIIKFINKYLRLKE